MKTPGTTDFYLIRHAPVIRPAHATGGWLYGWTDLDADVSDRAGLDALKARLPDEARVISSDLVRTVQTARALGLEPDSREPALREQHFGDRENTALSDLGAGHDIWQRPHAHRLPNGEAWTDVRARVHTWLKAFQAETDSKTDPQSGKAGKKVIIVAHSGSLRALLAIMLELPDATALRLHLDTLSLSTARHYRGVEGQTAGWRVSGINRTL